MLLRLQLPCRILRTRWGHLPCPTHYLCSNISPQLIICSDSTYLSFRTWECVFFAKLNDTIFRVQNVCSCSRFQRPFFAMSLIMLVIEHLGSGSTTGWWSRMVVGGRQWRVWVWWCSWTTLCFGCKHGSWFWSPSPHHQSCLSALFFLIEWSPPIDAPWVLWIVGPPPLHATGVRWLALGERDFCDEDPR